jgi:hypothetical protein
MNAHSPKYLAYHGHISMVMLLVGEKTLHQRISPSKQVRLTPVLCDYLIFKQPVILVLLIFQNQELQVPVF